MSKFNQCEKTHQDIDGFFAAVAEEGKALRIAKALGATKVIRLARTPTIIDLITANVPVAYENDSDIQLKEQAVTCAAAIINGTCTQFRLAGGGSLAAFEIAPREGS